MKLFIPNQIIKNEVYMLMFSVKEQQLSQYLKLLLVLTSVQYIQIACHRLSYRIWGCICSG